MKAEKLLEELMDLGKRMGFTISSEQGPFLGGSCVLHEEQLILINRSMIPEAAAVILARALARYDVDESFLKPAVRDILDRERAYLSKHPDVRIEPRTEAA